MLEKKEIGMETSNIKIMVELTVESDTPLTKNNKAREDFMDFVVANAKCDFSFTEEMNGNHVAIADANIMGIFWDNES